MIITGDAGSDDDTHDLVVPAGVTVLVLDMTMQADDDLDMTLNLNGTQVASSAAAGSGVAEHIEVDNPAVGTYQVTVSPFTHRRRQRAGGRGAGAADPRAGVAGREAGGEGLMRRFFLQRVRDLSGISGTGRVSDGVEFPDGVCVLRWRGDSPSTVVWPDATGLERVHGHGGATIIVWVDSEPA